MDKIKKKLPDKVYRYTSLEAFMNIINTGELWFGSTESANDSSECFKFINDIFEMVKDDLPQKLEDIEFHENKLKEYLTYPNILCFSTLYDDTLMWRAYGNNAEGICFEFKTKLLEDIFDWMAFKEKVVYDSPSEDHNAYKFLKEFINTKTVKALERDSKIEFNPEYLYRFIIASSYIFKHNSFKNEQEYRIIMDNYLFEPKSTKSFKFIKKQIREFRIVNLKQLCEKKSVNIEDLITEITIGPCSNQNIDVLKEFLKINGFNKLSETVKKSGCPLR